MVKCSAAAWLLCCAVCCSPLRALAQEDATRTRDAQAQFEQGMALAAQGRYASAEQAFRASFALVPRPNTQFNLAVALCKQDEFAACMQELAAFLGRTDPVRDAEVRQRALAMQAQASTHVARVRLRVSPASAIVSGADFTGAGAERAVYLVPGPHTISIAAPLYQPREIALDARAGREHTLEVTLARRSAPARRTARMRTEPEASAAVPWTLTITGGGLLAAAVITGVLALDADRDVTSRCEPGALPCRDGDLRASQSRAKKLATVTDALWIGGAASATVGLSWLLFFDGASAEKRDPRRAAIGRRAAMTVAGVPLW